MKNIFNFSDKKVVRIYMIGGAVLILAIVLYFASVTNIYSPSQAPNNKEMTEESTTSISLSETISYNDALKIYANKRIQFDENCVASPNFVTFKEGTKIMLDNRASKARPVYLDGQVYNLQAYGFKIITLTTSAALPHTIMVDCGTGKNNGRILLQQ